METEHLRALVEVVRCGSFAAAARALDWAPSQVTRAVAALEAQLGARLMNRTTRRMTLTQAGAAYVEKVGAALAELDHAAEEVRSSASEVRGTVRLTASVAFGQAAVVPLLAELHARHPQLQLDLVFSDGVVDLVAERVDLALRLGPSVDPSLIGVRLAPVRYRAVASPAYLKASGRPRRPADLAQCECLRFSLPGFRTLWRFRAADGSVEDVRVAGWLVAASALALHRGALDGLGPTLLAEWLVQEDIAHGRLVDLFPRHEATATNFDSHVWLVYASRAHQPRRVRAVIDFLKARLGAAT